jgi:hypothetical protein
MMQTKALVIWRPSLSCAYIVQAYCEPSYRTYDPCLTNLA